MVCLHALSLVDKTYGFVAAKGARKYQHIIEEVDRKRRVNNSTTEEMNKKLCSESDQLNLTGITNNNTER